MPVADGGKHRRMDEHAIPLVVTADDRLLDEVLRLCAAVGVTPVVAADVSAARRGWDEASIVVVCADLAPLLARSAPKRRNGVVVVGTSVAGGIWPAAVALGAEQVLELPSGQADMIDALANAMDGRDDACLVAVVGGAGGAGASTFAGALALAAAGRGLRSLLVDADPLGGGLDVLMGCEAVEGLRWPDVAHTEGRVSGESLRRALPLHAGLSTLSWDRGELQVVDATAMRSVLAAGRRSFDIIVADVPRTFDETTTEVISRAVLTILVVPEYVRALGSATRVLDRLKDTAAGVGLVTRTRSHGIGAEPIVESLGLPLLARIRSDRRLPPALDAGYGPLAGRTRSLRQGCTSVLDTLGLEAA